MSYVPATLSEGLKFIIHIIPTTLSGHHYQAYLTEDKAVAQ